MKKLLALLILALFLFGACDADEEDDFTDPDARTDTELQAVADQAAADSGLTDFTAVSTTTANDVADDVDEATSIASGSVDEGDSSSQLRTAALSAARSEASNAIKRAAASIQNRMGSAANGIAGGNNLTETDYPQSATANCFNTGTVTISGNVHATDNSDEIEENPETLTGIVITATVVFEDVGLAFDECSNDSAGATVWGAMLINSSNVGSGEFVSETQYDITATIDEYMDGGFAITDGTTNYNFTFTSDLDMTYAMTIDYETFTATATSIDATITVTVGSVTCTVTITDVAVMESDEDVPLTCT